MMTEGNSFSQKISEIGHYSTFIYDTTVISSTGKDDRYILRSFENDDVPCIRIDELDKAVYDEFVRYDKENKWRSFDECGLDEVFRVDGVEMLEYILGYDKIINAILDNDNVRDFVGRVQEDAPHCLDGLRKYMVDDIDRAVVEYDYDAFDSYTDVVYEKISHKDIYDACILYKGDIEHITGEKAKEETAQDKVKEKYELVYDTDECVNIRETVEVNSHMELMDLIQRYRKGGCFNIDATYIEQGDRDNEER